MVVWIITCIHRDDCGRWAAPWKHPDQDEICVVNPVKLGIAFCVEAFGLEHLDAAVRRFDIWVEFIGSIFRRVHISYW